MGRLSLIAGIAALMGAAWFGAMLPGPFVAMFFGGSAASVALVTGIIGLRIPPNGAAKAGLTLGVISLAVMAFLVLYLSTSAVVTTAPV